MTCRQFVDSRISPHWLDWERVQVKQHGPELYTRSRLGNTTERPLLCIELSLGRPKASQVCTIGSGMRRDLTPTDPRQ